nr:unnamed protein product [Callosobruchus chinensis]
MHYFVLQVVHRFPFKVNLESILPVDIIEGYHVKEINAIEVVKCLNKYILISGGEDTALRINMFKKHGSKNIITLKSHLSSIRAITTYRLDANTNLVFTAGGRAQVICWKLETFTENGTFKKLLCSEQHSYHKLTEVEESEMRIMDLNAAKINEKIPYSAHVRTVTYNYFRWNQEADLIG